MIIDSIVNWYTKISKYDTLHKETVKWYYLEFEYVTGGGWLQTCCELVKATSRADASAQIPYKIEAVFPVPDHMQEWDRNDIMKHYKFIGFPIWGPYSPEEAKKSLWKRIVNRSWKKF